jgi:hypothetical protein
MVIVKRVGSVLEDLDEDVVGEALPWGNNAIRLNCVYISRAGSNVSRRSTF